MGWSENVIRGPLGVREGFSEEVMFELTARQQVHYSILKFRKSREVQKTNCEQ